MISYDGIQFMCNVCVGWIKKILRAYQLSVGVKYIHILHLNVDNLKRSIKMENKLLSSKSFFAYGPTIKQFE